MNDIRSRINARFNENNDNANNNAKSKDVRYNSYNVISTKNSTNTPHKERCNDCGDRAGYEVCN